MTFYLTDEQLRSEGPPRRLDNSTRVQFAECPRAYYWNTRGVETAGRPVYFAWGQAWHSGLASWHRTGDLGEAQLRAEEVFLGESKGEIPVADTVHTSGRLRELLGFYAADYPSEPWEVIGEELGFEHPLPPIATGATYAPHEYFYCGSIDAYIDWPQFGTLLREDKTTGMWITDKIVGQWRFSSQVDGYIWFLQEFRGEKVFGCLMNIACKKTSKGGSTPQFARSLEQRTDEDLESFLRGVGHSFRELEHCWDQWFFPKAVNHVICAGGIGKSPCAYRNLCVQPQPYRELDPFSISGYTAKEEKWEPWKRFGDAGAGKEIDW